MMERIVIKAAIHLLRREETQGMAKAGCAMTVIGAFLLLIIPIILLAVPFILLGAAISSIFPGAADTIAASRQQIAYVESLCQAATSYELETWLEMTKDSLINSGIPEGNITVSLPPPSSLRIPASEPIIIWNVEYGEIPVDYRCKEIVDYYIEKRVSQHSRVSSGGVATHYAEITVSLRNFADVLHSRNLSADQVTIAWLMYDFAQSNNQLQRGIFLGNDQLYTDGDFSFYDGQTIVHYFHQRDNRWSNISYAGDSIGIAGCGPAAVAIVVSSLTQQNITPKEVASWAELNGYAAYNNGSYHSLILNALQHYGLAVSSGNDPDVLQSALQKGSLAIAIMGPGSFTPAGHFIVLRGITLDGSILVADPVSLDRSNRSWDVITIYNELRLGAGGGGPVWIAGKP